MSGTLKDTFYIFLLGIPGCGKSEIYNRLSERLVDDGLATECERLDDYPIIWDFFQKDGPKTRACDDGGYLILDDTLWDDVLQELNSKAQDTADAGKVVFLEFARGTNLQAMENFSNDVLNNGMIVYIYCPFEEAWRRNVARHEQAIKEGTDDHLVSREEMEKTYGSDDHEQLLADPPIPAVRVDNDENDMEKLARQVDDAYKKIKRELAARTAM